MTQSQRRVWLIRTLLAERDDLTNWSIPPGEREQRALLRSLFNLRPPRPVGADFLRVQDDYLQEELCRRGITDLTSLEPVQAGIYLWQGDITTLRCGGIVNAANSKLLGCFVPCHGCIDNAIHTYAGVQLRLACAGLMAAQGRDEETGRAKITPAFNLPCRYVLHTVGPVVRGELTGRDRELLAACYRSCLALAEEHGLSSLAFCCISTGEFHFPGREAAGIAVRTVQEYRAQTHSKMEVIFNVFKQNDYTLYRELLGAG